jgi:glycyl-tRNA synthetase beta chain
MNNSLKGKHLLFEIGTEEMPPSCIVEGVRGLKEILESKFTENRLKSGRINIYSSPRRLTASVDNLSEIQDSEEKIITGPPVGIAFDRSGNPTDAANGFAKSLDLKVSELEKIEVKGKGVYLGKRILDKGEKTKDLLPFILRDTILSINFSKQMTWGDYSIKFTRPIRWILALYGNEVIKFKIENLVSSNLTYGHRIISQEPITITDSKEYLEILGKKGRVIAVPEDRKNLILEQVKSLEEKIWKGKFKVVINDDLLSDVVNMVEMPNVIAGRFSEEFLYIPKELLVEAIQYHQKYFAVLDSRGNVSTNFIIVQNGIKDEGGIKKGNERVLRARLSDAAYFYEVDKKHDFDYWTEKLKGVVFFSGLGSIYDKSVRLEKITARIVDLLKKKEAAKSDNLQKNLARASMICKCDLVTDMVVEFPSLQGVVGRQYSRERGESDEIPSAVFEHYLPRFADDILPSNDVGLILSIADKIDSIAGLFLVGEIPTGSEDPFALRRKASGIVLSVLKGGYDFSLDDLIDYNLRLYAENSQSVREDILKVAGDIRDFVIARFRFMLEKEGKRLDILELVLGSGCSSITDINLRYNAVEEFIKEKDVKKLYFPVVRCRNIIKGGIFSEVDAGLLIEDNEKKLYQYINEKVSLINKLSENKKYKSVLEELYNLGGTVDAFFDRVLVMDKDERLRTNRINLVKKALDLYLLMGDFSKLEVINNS